MEVIAAILDRTPPRLRPALLGAVLLFFVVGLRIIFAIPHLWHQPGALGSVVLTLATATAAGAAGGLSYSLLGAPLRRIRGIGPYLAGIVTISGYLAALAVAAPYAFGKRVVERPSDIAVFGLITIPFGLVLGYLWFRDESPEADGTAT